MDRSHEGRDHAEPSGGHPGMVLEPALDGKTMATRLAAERHRRIEVRAYFMAEARGFAPGYALDDWLVAEVEEDAAERSL
jgi:hypothetical protein